MSILLYWQEYQVTTPSTGSELQYWTGSAWVSKPLKRWNGSAWVSTTLKYWDGASWVTV